MDYAQIAPTECAANIANSFLFTALIEDGAAKPKQFVNFLNYGRETTHSGSALSIRSIPIQTQFIQHILPVSQISVHKQSSSQWAEEEEEHASVCVSD